MHLVTIANRPYAVINGKDYAVCRWFSHHRQGPLFLQLAGRTPLSKEDLPQNDWVVQTIRDGQRRISTTWRQPWFDHRMDASRKLAFLGASTAGSLFLALRYIASRFGVAAEPSVLRARADQLTANWNAPWIRVLERVRDSGMTENVLIVLDLPSHFDAGDAASLLDIPS
ncbi:MAG: hypothetical protein DIJKHBIC_02322 [Thermoanaerobaculia bacterium]|nr:hypothetical protein [Thermoanaerobaculia bacterium]